METGPYTEAFYAINAPRARTSAEVILPFVLRGAEIASIVDVGCGTGSWLAAAQRLGVKEVYGIDGAHIDPSVLEIPTEYFLPHDLTLPLDLGRAFDLAMCLEVAEHLPATAAPTLIESLTRLAPLVLFSAAVPLQPGTRHVNSQWPSYWAALFGARDYYAIDTVRPHVWDDNRVAWWYAQNTLLYVRRGRSWRGAPDMTLAGDSVSTQPLALVHPQNYLSNPTLGEYYLARQPLKRLLAVSAARMVRAAGRRLGRRA